MDICYLCGQEMVEKPQDYNSQLNKHQNLAIRHNEHIIQNALYGRLKNNKILCESCGGKLGADIDSGFSEIFRVLTEPLKHKLISKDRDSKDSPTLNGYIKQNGIRKKILIRNNRVIPKDYYYEYDKSENKVYVYCLNKNASEYTNHVKKQLVNDGIDIGNINFEIRQEIPNIKILETFFSEDNPKFNIIMRLGLNKIATGFAIAHKIDRVNLPRTLDVINKKIIYTGNIFPFCPHSVVDKKIEELRDTVEDGYPTHTLILYTDNSLDKKLLVCYIDLFSTFQFYIILNDDFRGKDIQETYYQRTINQEKQDYLDIRGTEISEINILAEDIGVSMEELAGKTIEETYTYLEKKYERMQRTHTLNLLKYIHGIVKCLSNILIIEIMSEEIMSENNIDDIILIKYELERIETDERLNYRQNYLEIDSQQQSYYYSTLAKMIEMYQSKPEMFKEYGHLKFNQLKIFTERNKLNK